MYVPLTAKTERNSRTVIGHAASLSEMANYHVEHWSFALTQDRQLFSKSTKLSCMLVSQLMV